MTGPVPLVAAPPLPRVPRLTAHRIEGGPTVWAVRKPRIPMVEVRVWMPAVAATAAQRARTSLLARTMLAGTAGRDDLDLAEAIQAIGGSVRVSGGVDGVVVRASALARHLGDLAKLLGEVLGGAAYPAARVRNRRERLRRELLIQRSNPATVASDAIARRAFGRHPYGLGTPEPSQVDRIGPAALRRRHDDAVRACGATLVVVGDARPAQAAARIAAGLEGWAGGPSPPAATAPRHNTGLPVLVVHRPGAVQTNIRLSGPSLTRADDDYPALSLAVLAFGGYFASRLVANLREDKGYTYAPRAAVDHRSAASRLAIGADVATEVTGAAFLELSYELGRMVTDPPAAAELTSARRYRIGGLGTSLQTQAGLTAQLGQLATGGLKIGWLRDHFKRLERVGDADVAAVARRWLAPAGMVTVLVGDADAIVPQLDGLAEIEVVS